MCVICNKIMKLNNIVWIFSLFVVDDFKLYVALGNVGGHALFASMSQLEVLWQNEIIIAQMLETMLEKFTNPPTSVSM